MTNRIRLVGHVICKGEKRSTYRVLVVKPERKRRLERHRNRRENNIKMDL
jgi:hypothetical protein